MFGVFKKKFGPVCLSLCFCHLKINPCTCEGSICGTKESRAGWWSGLLRARSRAGTCWGETLGLKLSHEVLQLATKVQCLSSLLRPSLQWSMHVLEIALTSLRLLQTHYLIPGLYIGHLPCPHTTTALVCQKCSTRASCLASCPLSNSCPINVPPRYGECSKGREFYP